jgi:hypothetical protein
MPIHDWTRVSDSTFHAFHSQWGGRLVAALNGGLLPSGYYALPEQIATRMQTDVLTLHRLTPASAGSANGSGGVAVAEAPPRARLRLRPDPERRPKQTRRRPKSVVVRHVSDHRIVAVIEIVSTANKDRRDHVRDLAGKVVAFIEAGISVLLIDLLPVTRHDPHGIHGAVWAHYDTKAYSPPDDGPLTLAAYVGQPGDPEAFVEPVAVGQDLPDMPLFLCPERYVYVPLEATYLSALRELPAFVREELEGEVPRASPAAGEGEG